jgi:hypothetical protein
MWRQAQGQLHRIGANLARAEQAMAVKRYQGRIDKCSCGRGTGASRNEWASQGRRGSRRGSGVLCLNADAGVELAAPSSGNRWCSSLRDDAHVLHTDRPLARGAILELQPVDIAKQYLQHGHTNTTLSRNPGSALQQAGTAQSPCLSSCVAAICCHRLTAWLHSKSAVGKSRRAQPSSTSWVACDLRSNSLAQPPCMQD